MSTTNCTAEAFTYTMMVSSRLGTGRMVIMPLATSSTYTVMVTSMWGRDTRRMEWNGQEALSTLQMVLKRSLTFWIEIVINH